MKDPKRARRLETRLRTVRKRLEALLREPEVLRSKRLYHKIRLAFARSDPEESLGRDVARKKTRKPSKKEIYETEFELRRREAIANAKKLKDIATQIIKSLEDSTIPEGGLRLPLSLLDASANIHNLHFLASYIQGRLAEQKGVYLH